MPTRASAPPSILPLFTRHPAVKKNLHSLPTTRLSLSLSLQLMALFTSISTTPLSISAPIYHRPSYDRLCFSCPCAALSSSSPSSHESRSPVPAPPSDTKIPSATSSSNSFVVEPSRPPDSGLNYAFANPKGHPFTRFLRSTESSIERAIFDFRFLALLAVGGSLAGSLLCFLNGCVYIGEAYKIYWSSCVKGIHTGQMVLRLVEAIDVYLAGTVMLIFGMGLYGLFISNVSPDVPSSVDRALKGSSLFGMFALKERPKWMKISSLDELKTKVGHVIVMILLVKMFERSKMVQITTGVDLLSYSVCIFLSSASLYILHNLHKSD